MRSTSRAAALLLLLLAPALAGCRGERSPDRPAASVRPAGRIIALTPSVTETLFALGLGDRVVGVGDYSRWPPESLRKPRLGALFNPNLERIVALKPNLAVLIPSERGLGTKLTPLGVDLLVVPDESLADVEASFHTIARRCGVPAAGERLAAEWRAGLSLPPLPGPPLKVLISVGRRPGSLGEVTVAGPRTFLDELLKRLGGENVFADAPTLYPQIGLEEIVARKPDVILELRADPMTPDAVAATVADWQALPQVPAVRLRHVEVIAGDEVLIPGPRIPLFYRKMREALARARPANLGAIDASEAPRPRPSPLPLSRPLATPLTGRGVQPNRSCSSPSSLLSLPSLSSLLAVGRGEPRQ
ncbi:MAG TPA: helical backbone metal receptor [Thermoanaerobaculia bacterium]|nr:helical backbone metal receptor [Thermoanaerobaculia bacterium]